MPARSQPGSPCHAQASWGAMADLASCLPHTQGQGGGEAGAAGLAAQAAKAAAQLRKRYPGLAAAVGEASGSGKPEAGEGQPGGGSKPEAGEGEEWPSESGSEGGSGLGDFEDDEEEPSAAAARQQRREDWAARAGWGPEPAASPQELAGELARCILDPGAQGWGG